MPQTIRADKFGIYLKCAGQIYRPFFPIDYPPKLVRSKLVVGTRVQCDPRIGTPLTVLSTTIADKFLSETWFSHGAYMRPNGTYKPSEECYKPFEYTWSGDYVKEKPVEKVTQDEAYLSDNDGTFEPWEICTKTCFNCAGEHVQKRYWVSNDDNYEDEQFRCEDCGHTWWVDEEPAMLGVTVNEETKST